MYIGVPTVKLEKDPLGLPLVPPISDFIVNLSASGFPPTPSVTPIAITSPSNP